MSELKKEARPLSQTNSGAANGIDRSNGRQEEPVQRDFARTSVWIFDLDNTLYPAACNLFAEVDVRMTEFIQATRRT